MRKTVVSIGAAGILLGIAGNASAADNYTLFLMDQTGSMSDLPRSLDAGEGDTRWKDSLYAASSWVTYDSNNDPEASPIPPYGEFTRGFAIFTFRNDAPNQEGVIQVWPQTQSDCADILGATSETLTIRAGLPDETEVLFCVGTKLRYNQIGDRIGTLNTYLDAHPEISGGGSPAGTTPLASSLCEVINLMRDGASYQVTYIVETDGDENDTDTTDVCYGTDPSEFDSFDPTMDNWGVDTDTWHFKVLQRAKAFDTLPVEPPPDYVTAPTNGDPIAMPDRLTFRLDTHYSVCEAGQCEPVGGASAAALFGLSPSASAAVLSDIPGALLSRLDGGAMPAFIPPGSLSAITDAELTMFEYLSTSTETSAFRAFIRDPEGPQFGVDHPLAGDVNNSNCVDRVDLGALMADGVYLHEAVPPNDAAIQADLDHDGWAGPGDRTLVLDNLGSNCPYPVCGDGEQEGLEQCDDGNVDDGDGCSTWCLAEVTSMATLQKWNDWGTGYCATLHITNDDSIATKKWTVVLNANNTDIYTLWNANTQYDGNVVTLKPLSWNARIQPGQTNSSVGFCAFRRTGDMESEAFVYSAIGY